MSTPEYTPYKDALTNAMKELGQKEDTIFIGQQILWHGNPMSTTIGDVPKDKLIEFTHRFYRLWARNQWKRERYAPGFHVDDYSLDPKSWLRFPILSAGLEKDLPA